MASASIQESNALLNWKAKFANQTQSLLSSWILFSHNASTNPCTWFVISCNSAGSVIKMNINSFGFNGMLHEFSFSSFPNLKYVDLAMNSLFNSLPSAFLSKLIYFDLSTNQFSGKISPEIGLLLNLQVLHLVENQLNGSIPQEIGCLRSLKELALHSNHLHGSIPTSIGNLINLEFIYLSNNKLSGPIPPKIGNLKSLVNLSFSLNNLSGSIPSSFGGSRNLTFLLLYENQLSGLILEELGS
ncbi:hypothetical protein LWI28_015408 [Acer negundo]|uniref:Leucine-rich repeat-containing N-terminal plant-type domain-containing protein n=1 Tax=Acer negundo TaxID=4023 RepID=A0AAD5NKY3_ACENE|nr:hypothetical protein LWI28_015408 [Acer negundo]